MAARNSRLAEQFPQWERFSVYNILVSRGWEHVRQGHKKDGRELAEGCRRTNQIFLEVAFDLWEGLENTIALYYAVTQHPRVDH